MAIYLASSSVSGGLAVAAFVIALFSALVGGLSYYNSAASTTKKAWLDRGLEAYRALIAWRALSERARIAAAIEVDELWNRLFDARAASALHQASLYAESKLLGRTYHAAVEAATAAYEPTILAILEAKADVSGVDVGEAHADTELAERAETARRAFLDQLKRSASYYRTLRKWHLGPKLEELPDWL